jgi:carboxyvinyl-carboxyphosphonate phosphorylmutase
MMLLSERRERYRQVLAGTACVHPASVFDPTSARLAESLGFEIGMLAGSIASATVLGAPDLVVLTLTEFAEQIRRITRVSSLSLMVDADHGYGNALNVMRTVEELEAAGVSALTIEDTLLPPPFAGGEGESLISQAEMVGKLRAAVAARQDPSLVILGRTAVLRYASLAEAEKRISAYADTGIDGLFLAGVRTGEQLEAVHRMTSMPLLLGGAPPELADRAYLAAQGVRIALQGHMPYYASIKATYEVLKHLRDGGATADLRNAVASDDILDIALKRGDYARWQKDYLH